MEQAEVSAPVSQLYLLLPSKANLKKLQYISTSIQKMMQRMQEETEIVGTFINCGCLWM